MTTTEAITGSLYPPFDPAPNVIQALARVMDELPGIGKTEQSPQGYAYRGIEQITQHAQPLFAKHGVVLAPHAVEWRETVNLTINGRPWTEEKMIIHYRCYGPGGALDYIDIEVPSAGRDNADKGPQKAMTAAYKYALLQTLCISDAKDDVDSHPAAEADAYDPEAPSSWATKERMLAIREACKVLRERGQEVTDSNDDGEVSVLNTPLLVRQEGNLVAAVTNAEAQAILDSLTDLIMKPAEEPPSEPQEPVAQPEAESPPETPAEPETATQAPEPEPPGAAPEGEHPDVTKARALSYVTQLNLGVVREQLTARDLPLDGTPAKVRARLVDAIAAEARA